MMFVISSSELLRGVLAVNKAIPAKTTLPVLENFLFSLKDNTLEITASDTELTLRTTVEVEKTLEEGSICIPADHLVNMLKELPDQPVTIGTVTDSSFVCEWGTGESTLPYFPAADYPDIPSVDGSGVTVTFDAQDLVDGISGTIYATADDEIRPIMNGILFDITEEGTTLVASDSHKLICYNIKETSLPVKDCFILHKRPAGVIRSLIGKNVETVTVSFDKKIVSLSFENTLALCRLINGNYPRYRDVIPQNNPNILKIDRSVLLNTARRIAVFANKASNYIKFVLSGDVLEVSAQDLGFSIAGFEKIACQYLGEDLTIGFKSTFLIEILSNMNCNDLTIKFADGKRAALIVPGENEAESEKVCGILMPIMI